MLKISCSQDKVFAFCIMVYQTLKRSCQMAVPKTSCRELARPLNQNNSNE